MVGRHVQRDFPLSQYCVVISQHLCSLSHARSDNKRMWHPCRLTEISRGDALNYLKVCSSVIVLTVVYPVGMAKSVSIEPQLEYSYEETNASGFLQPSCWKRLCCARLRGIKEKSVAALKLNFSCLK